MLKDNVIIGWCGGCYEGSGLHRSHAGLFKTKEDADRGYIPDEAFHQIFERYDGKRIKITIEVIEE